VDTAYTGGETLTFDEGTCTIEVLGTGDTDRTIQATGTVGDVVRYLEVYTETVTPTMVIDRWEDVASL
jgi:hypothetical protein